MKVKDIEQSFVTNTGVNIYVRPLRAADAPYLVDLFEHMGTESRYNRFLQSTDNVGMDRIWSEAENIAYLTDGRSYGVIAFSDLPEREHAPVAAARYVLISAQQAEIAVSVRDDMQHMGIGTELLRIVIEHATERGIEQLVGTVQNSNAPMWAVLKKLGHRLERYPEGSYSYIVFHINETAGRLEDWMDTAADFSPEPQIIW